MKPSDFILTIALAVLWANIFSWLMFENSIEENNSKHLCEYHKIERACWEIGIDKPKE